MALTHKSSIYFLRFLSVISNSKRVKFNTNSKNTKITRNYDLTPENMRAFVIHRLLLLYSYRVSLEEAKDARW